MHDPYERDSSLPPAPHRPSAFAPPPPPRPRPSLQPPPPPPIGHDVLSWRTASNGKPALLDEKLSPGSMSNKLFLSPATSSRRISSAAADLETMSRTRNPPPPPRHQSPQRQQGWGTHGGTLRGTLRVSGQGDQWGGPQGGAVWTNSQQRQQPALLSSRPLMAPGVGANRHSSAASTRLPFGISFSPPRLHSSDAAAGSWSDDSDDSDGGLGANGGGLNAQGKRTKTNKHDDDVDDFDDGRTPPGGVGGPAVAAPLTDILIEVGRGNRGVHRGSHRGSHRGVQFVQTDAGNGGCNNGIGRSRVPSRSRSDRPRHPSDGGNNPITAVADCFLKADARGPATSFVPAGAVSHFRGNKPEDRAAAAAATTATREAAAAAGAPDKHAIAQMVRARLKPAYARGAMIKAVFKEVAQAATRSATAAAAAAALRLRSTTTVAIIEEGEAAVTAAVAAAVGRAVDTAMRNAGLSP